MLLGTNTLAWERWITTFFEAHGDVGKAAIGAVVPIGSPMLSRDTYDRVLEFYLSHDPARFLVCVRQWNGAPQPTASDAAGHARAGTSHSDGDSVLTDLVTDVVGKEAAASLPIGPAEPLKVAAAPRSTPLFSTARLIQGVKVSVGVMDGLE
jgi:hypothetical protein